MATNDYFDIVSARWERESLFARDMDGQLIRAEPATQADYDKEISLTIDGEPITVPKAVPKCDAQGNILLDDAEGRTVPKLTTIYDAAMLLARRRDSLNPQAAPFIPTLCHAEHLNPVGVCRVCSVEVAKLDEHTKEEIVEDKLVPACVQPVKENMIVRTLNSSNKRAADHVGRQVSVLLELLAGDHLPDGHDGSELSQLIERLAPQLRIDTRRFRPQQPSKLEGDKSSSLISVDHNACILCDRCVRACTDIKENFVIGRTGKGYTTRIGFDLNDSMGDSSCVECGECMLHCPTTALTFYEPVEKSEWYREQMKLPGRSPVTPDEMATDSLLKHLPYRYRQWNQFSIVRRRVQAGDDPLCVAGEHGFTAFILRSGRFAVWLGDRRSRPAAQQPASIWQRVFGRANQPTADLGQPDYEVTSDDLILGEMTCMNHYPRQATLRAMEDGEVWEIRRNVLFALQRNPECRRRLDEVYRTRTIANQLKRVPLFEPLSEDERKACERFLTEPTAKGEPRLHLIRLQPGQTIFRQGERADREESSFYIVHVGHVKVSRTFGGEERVLNYLGPAKNFGAVSLLTDLEEMQRLIPQGLEGCRTATCTALDNVELVAVRRDDFRELVRQSPGLREILRKQHEAQSQQNENAPMRPVSPLYQEFTEQGLYNAQKLLVLDLEACTRCDECVKACADVHDGPTRFIRDGLRFDKWLVASACRSCTDPYCLVGCPVDAIHREGGRLQINIEDHCIGCGQCASNCPYGNINMQPTEKKTIWGRSQLTTHATIASVCDLCKDVVKPHQEVSCVFACPHHAAFRMSGPELLQLVESKK